MGNAVRWKQRLENFERALLLLREAFEKDPTEMSDLEKEGVIQRFEYTFELAWKTLKDYLVYSGIVFDQITPRSVIKQAFAAKIIEDGQTWINMLEQRNPMSHTYDKAIFDAVFPAISQYYLAALEQVYRVRIGKFGLSPEALELIREVFRRHPEVRQVKIFGSRALGRFEDYSDVDMALWGNLDQGLIARIMAELDELPLPYTFDVQTYESINHEPLRRHIDEAGRVLYVAH